MHTPRLYVIIIVWLLIITIEYSEGTHPTRVNGTGRGCMLLLKKPEK